MTFARAGGEVTSPPVIGRWALLAVLRGRRSAPRDELGSPGTLARWNRAYLGFADAVVLGRVGRRDEALEAARAADELMTMPVPILWHRHHALRLVAEAALADGWGDPVTWLRGSLAYFESTGHDRIADACRGLLRRAGAPVPRRGRGDAEVPPRLRALGVTSREMDVLLLVGEGLGNRDIAGRLYLSPRTVEKHVERLIAKTRAGTRAALVAYAATRGWSV
jgi:DNA-binding CsgD family transcriptional regulator